VSISSGRWDLYDPLANTPLGLPLEGDWLPLEGGASLWIDNPPVCVDRGRKSRYLQAPCGDPGGVRLRQGFIT